MSFSADSGSTQDSAQLKYSNDVGLCYEYGDGRMTLDVCLLHVAFNCWVTENKGLTARQLFYHYGNHVHSKICVVIVTANLLVQPNSHSYLVAS